MTTKNKHTELYIFGLITPDYEKGESNRHEKKIGVSGKGDATTLTRLAELNSKQQPFQVMCHKRWKFPDIVKPDGIESLDIEKLDDKIIAAFQRFAVDARVVEKHLHDTFKLEGRESPRGDKSTEWWSDHDDNLIEIVESQVLLLQKLGHKVEELSAADTDKSVPSPTDAAKTREDKVIRRSTRAVFTELTQDGEFEKHFEYNKPYKAKELAAILEKNYPAWSAFKNSQIKTQVPSEISNRDEGFWSKHLGQKIIIQKPWKMTFERN